MRQQHTGLPTPGPRGCLAPMCAPHVRPTRAPHTCAPHVRPTCGPHVGETLRDSKFPTSGRDAATWVPALPAAISRERSRQQKKCVRCAVQSLRTAACNGAAGRVVRRRWARRPPWQLACAHAYRIANANGRVGLPFKKNLRKSRLLRSISPRRERELCAKRVLAGEVTGSRHAGRRPSS